MKLTLPQLEAHLWGAANILRKRSGRSGRNAYAKAREDTRNEFTAVVERNTRWHIAYCPEIPDANSQGRTKAAALSSLSDAIALILEDRRSDR